MASRILFGKDEIPAELRQYFEPAHNVHPTIKNIALTEYLARLILPPQRDTPRRLLNPFSGSGSEILGAIRAGWDETIGIELEDEYVAIAERRIAHELRQPKLLEAAD